MARYWFNKAVDYLKKPGTKAYLPELRKLQKDPHPEWALNCPQRIREHALKDACAAVKEAKRKYKVTGKVHEVSFRRRKDQKQSFGFDKQSLEPGELFRAKDFKLKFFVTENFFKELEGTEVIKENGRWYLVIPNTVSVKVPENQRLAAVALDPGVRTFQTYYSPQFSGKVGNGDFNRIFRLCINLDKVYAKLSKADYTGKRRLKKASQRLRWKIKDLIDDVHKKFAYFLVTRFETIIIPTFETSQMVTKLHSKVARSMLNWAHFRFKSFLKMKAEEYSCRVIEVNEAYTSKTCSYCGRIQNIGSKKNLVCKCGICVDRDFNGARGIFLKTFTENTQGLGGYALPEFNQVVNLSNFVRSC